MADWSAIREAVIRGDAPTTRRLTEDLVEAGAPASEVLQQGLIPAMDEVGRRMRAQEYYVPEVMLSARAMQYSMNVLRPLLAQAGGAPAGRYVIGTVQGDLHDIGKNLVAMMMEGTGFEVIDLGVNVPPDRFVQTVKETGAKMVGMSALLTTTMSTLKTTIEALKAAGLRDRVKVMVGGAAVTERYAIDIGADGYAHDAALAVSKAKELAGLA